MKNSFFRHMAKVGRRSNEPTSLSLLISLSLFMIACYGQDKTTQDNNPELYAVPAATSEVYVDPFEDLHVDQQLMLVVRRVFQDRQKHIWIIGDGVFCFDGDSLIDFSDHEVFRKTTVREMLEDFNGNLWFATHTGIVKYDPLAGKNPEADSFSQFFQKDGLIGNDVWSMAIDRKGTIWLGTLDGVSRLDPEEGIFSTFALPETEPDETRGVTSSKIVHSMMEDHAGNIWFSTNGGAFIYDPVTENLSQISEKDGLCHNVVNDILEDKDGNIWFATHHNGVCRWDGKTFTHLSNELGIKGTEAWSLFEDQAGNIWFPIEHEGIYRYSPISGELTNFYKEQGLMMGVVHRITEDEQGKFWMGGFGGVYRYDPAASSDKAEAAIVNLTHDGSWFK